MITIEKMLTIIVPVYNGAPYLKKCLSSFIAPDLIDTIEVIVVDDGSQDDTAKIANNFCQKYPDIFRLEQKSNGGHGSAINFVLPLVRGKYLKAVDADDWVVTENLQRLIPILKETQADAIITEFDIINIRTGQVMNRMLEYPAGKPLRLEQIVKQFPQGRSSFSYHGLFFKTEVYRKAGFQLSEGIFYEDHEYATLPFAQVKTVLPVALCIYQYRIGDAKQSVAFHNQVRRIHHIEQVMERILTFQANTPYLNSAQKRYFRYKLADILTSYYAVALVKNPKKQEGRRQAIAFHAQMEFRCPSLSHMIEKKYQILLALNRLHFPASLYQALLDMGLGKIFRKWWQEMS